ncbi:22098_t:CDS:1, partial [Cetraspora pellucida]
KGIKNQAETASDNKEIDGKKNSKNNEEKDSEKENSGEENSKEEDSEENNKEDNKDNKAVNYDNKDNNTYEGPFVYIDYYREMRMPILFNIGISYYNTFGQ